MHKSIATVSISGLLSEKLPQEVNGQTVSRIALPADTSGLEVVIDSGRQETQAHAEALRRKVEWLEQEVRRLQGQVRSR